jgi:outer membrane protein assembly factor BamE (lipoprotein component of BamABCDE complex)
MKKIAVALTGLAAVALAGCSSNADVVSENISKAAENFEVARRVVFVDTFTNEYLYSIEGRCNITADGDGGGQLEVTCRTPQGDKKHFLGLAVGVTYFVEQMNPSTVSQDHYKVYFKPSVIIPDVDAK